MTVASATNAQYRGPGGFLSEPGLENAVISTHVTPMGIDEYIPVTPTTTVNPLYPVFTGVTDEIGNEPAQVCDDAPTAFLTAGYLTSMFGRVIRDTPTLDVGQLPATTRGETTDLTLYASMGRKNGLWPGGVQGQDASILVDATRGAMFVLGTQFQRKFSKLLWQGDPAVNNPSQPGYLEFPGLDKQIVTGQKDARSNSLLPSVDSYVKDANNGLISTMDIVAQLEDIERMVFFRALEMFGGADFAFVMRPELWDELTKVWPIQYNTQSVSKLLSSTGVSVNIDGAAMVSERDRMRSSMSLTVNGRTYPVILDHGIKLLHAGNGGGALPAGRYSSTIYLVPLRAGGLPVLRIEHMDFSKMPVNMPGFAGHEDFWTDGGRYLWSQESRGSCFKLKARIEPRIVLHTPHLAAKLQRVAFHPMSMVNDPDPDSVYHIAGGVSVRPLTTDYAVWK